MSPPSNDSEIPVLPGQNSISQIQANMIRRLSQDLLNSLSKEGITNTKAHESEDSNSADKYSNNDNYSTGDYGVDKELSQTKINMNDNISLNSNEYPNNDNNEKKKKVEKTGWRKYIGMIMTLSASLNFSFGVLFAKTLQSYTYHGHSASFWRYIGVTVPAIPLLLYYEFGYLCKSETKAQNKFKKHGGSISAVPSTVSIISKDTIPCSDNDNDNKPLIKQHESVFNTVWPLHVNDNWKTAIGVFLRGFFAATAVVLRYYALEYLPIADTSVISYSTPVIVTIMAHFFLGEKAGVISYIIAFTTLIGVVIVTKPPVLTGQESFTSDILIGTGLAVASLLCASTQIILTRVIRSVHFSLLTVTVGLIGLGIGGGMALYFDDFDYPKGFEDGALVLGLTMTSFFGQMSIILALKFEQAGPVALIRTSDVVFGFILQYIFLKVIPEWTSVVGGILVVGGVLVTAARKWLQMLPDTDSRKRTFRFLLV